MIFKKRRAAFSKIIVFRYIKCMFSLLGFHVEQTLLVWLGNENQELIGKQVEQTLLVWLEMGTKSGNMHLV